MSIFFSDAKTMLLFAIFFIFSLFLIRIKYAPSQALSNAGYTPILPLGNSSSIFPDEEMAVVLSYMHMEKSSLRNFIHHVSGKKYYLEWGTGGSTQIAPLLVSAKSFSIEHAHEWCNKSRGNDMIKVLMSLNRVQILCMQHSVELEKWGKIPADFVEQFAGPYLEMGDQASSSLESEDPNSKGKFDVIFIDGRYRAACALYAILKDFSHLETVLLIHDFGNRRKEYGIVLRYFNIIEGGVPGSSLVVLQRKEHISYEDLKSDFNLAKKNSL